MARNSILWKVNGEDFEKRHWLKKWNPLSKKYHLFLKQSQSLVVKRITVTTVDIRKRTAQLLYTTVYFSNKQFWNIVLERWVSYLKQLLSFLLLYYQKIDSKSRQNTEIKLLEMLRYANLWILMIDNSQFIYKNRKS